MSEWERKVCRLKLRERGNRKNAAVAIDDTNHGKRKETGNKHKGDGFTWQHNFICWRREEKGRVGKCWLNLQVLKLNKSFFPFDIKRASSSSLNDKSSSFGFSWVETVCGTKQRMIFDLFYAMLWNIIQTQPTTHPSNSCHSIHSSISLWFITCKIFLPRA